MLSGTTFVKIAADNRCTRKTTIITVLAPNFDFMSSYLMEINDRICEIIESL